MCFLFLLDKKSKMAYCLYNNSSRRNQQERRETMKINFSRSNGPVDEIIEQLMETTGGIKRPE